MNESYSVWNDVRNGLICDIDSKTREPRYQVDMNDFVCKKTCLQHIVPTVYTSFFSDGNYVIHTKSDENMKYNATDLEFYNIENTFEFRDFNCTKLPTASFKKNNQ